MNSNWEIKKLKETELKTIKAPLKSSLVMGLESTTSRMKRRRSKLFDFIWLKNHNER
ncbi:MAG: hypothetical protein U9P79_04380 [Candidatus Cloacimonadota bacterium]|nr:hypothetical protein [Candidatus Cloacimonadota bacterium]